MHVGTLCFCGLAASTDCGPCCRYLSCQKRLPQQSTLIAAKVWRFPDVPQMPKMRIILLMTVMMMLMMVMKPLMLNGVVAAPAVTVAAAAAGRGR